MPPRTYRVTVTLHGTERTGRATSRSPIHRAMVRGRRISLPSPRTVGAVAYIHEAEALVAQARSA
jgi:hypothetical protein